jgi:poly(3-hydroxybutyrate) depolymerase
MEHQGETIVKLLWAMLLTVHTAFCATNLPVQHSLAYQGVNRPYAVYTPSNVQPAGSRAVEIVLHGRHCGTSPVTNMDYGWEYTARQTGNGFLVVMPSATGIASAPGCASTLWEWNWYGACELGVFQAQACPDDSGFLAALVAELVANYGVDPSRVYIHGFSAGAHMAYRLAIEQGTKFAGVSINSGLPETGASDANIFTLLPSSINGNPSLIVLHGTADTTAGGVNPCSGKWAKNQAVPASTIDGAFDYFTTLQGWTPSSSQPLCVNGVLQPTGKTASDASGNVKLTVIPLVGIGHQDAAWENGTIWNTWRNQ